MKTNIADVQILEKEPAGNRWIIAAESDHVLRRFGQIELRRLAQGEETEYLIREKADELWSVLDGKVEFALVDMRSVSPSFGIEDRIILDENVRRTLLIPFGVAYRLCGRKGVVLMRVTTHEDNGCGESRVLSKKEVRTALKKSG